MNVEMERIAEVLAVLMPAERLGDLMNGLVGADEDARLTDEQVEAAEEFLMALMSVAPAAAEAASGMLDGLMPPLPVESCSACGASLETFAGEQFCHSCGAFQVA